MSSATWRVQGQLGLHKTLSQRLGCGLFLPWGPSPSWGFLILFPYYISICFAQKRNKAGKVGQPVKNFLLKPEYPSLLPSPLVGLAEQALSLNWGAPDSVRAVSEDTAGDLWLLLVLSHTFTCTHIKKDDSIPFPC